MVLDTNENLIYITLDELISFSYPSGSLVKTKDFYEKPRSASSIAEEISEQTGLPIKTVYQANIQ